jgi:hypothetical protein
MAVFEVVVAVFVAYSQQHPRQSKQDLCMKVTAHVGGGIAGNIAGNIAGSVVSFDPSSIARKFEDQRDWIRSTGAHNRDC